MDDATIPAAFSHSQGRILMRGDRRPSDRGAVAVRTLFRFRNQLPGDPPPLPVRMNTEVLYPRLSPADHADVDTAHGLVVGQSDERVSRLFRPRVPL